MSSIKDRLLVFRDERGDIASKIVLAVMAIAVLAGVYFTGKRVERNWWRAQIAAKSAAVNQIMSTLDSEAPDFDERLIREWARENVAPLQAAQAKLREIQSRPEPAGEPRCNIAADCLR